MTSDRVNKLGFIGNGNFKTWHQGANHAPSVLLTTSSLEEYAVAAAAARSLARSQGWRACYPVMNAPDSGGIPPAFLDRYGIMVDRFTSHGSNEAAELDAQTLRRVLFASSGDPNRVSGETGFGTLAEALYTAVCSRKPLSLCEGKQQNRLLDPARSLRAGRPGHWLFARAASPFAIPAAFYAASTGKNFRLVESCQCVFTEPINEEICTVILADEYQTFNKEFLHNLSALVSSRPGQLSHPGFLTAYSLADLTRFVFRLLASRDRRLAGNFFAEPRREQAVSLNMAEPLEYYVLTGHGNEIHVQHDDDEVVCGAALPERQRAGDFDCEPGCPYKARIRAGSIPVLNFVMLSCDSSTFGDGFTPAEYSVVVNLLSGWCISVIASFKHAVINTWVTVLAEALIRAGYTLGEIAHRLNTIARLDSSPDSPFVLIGDPETAASAEAVRGRHTTVTTQRGDGVDVACVSEGCGIIDCDIPSTDIAGLMEVGRVLAVEPLSHELTAADILFAFRPNRRSGRLGVLIFSTRDFGAGTHRFRIRPTRGPSGIELERLRKCLAAANIIPLFGVKPELAFHWISVVSKQLNAVAAYPRVPELLAGHILAERFGAALDAVFSNLRVAFLRSIRDLMAREALWISHNYGDYLPEVRQLRDGDESARCPTCGNATSLWSYQGASIEGLARSVRICIRCGIISDTPSGSELTTHFPREAVIMEQRFRRTVTIQNRSARSQSIEVMAQFNDWKTHGTRVEPVGLTLVLDAGQEMDCEFEFEFEQELKDDILGMHVFAITEDLLLHCFTQRMLSRRFRPPTGCPDGPRGRAVPGIVTLIGESDK